MLEPEPGEPRERETRDRHEPLRDSGGVEPGDDPPDGLVPAEVRAEREQAGHERSETEDERQPAPLPDRHEARDREERRQPPDEDELLHAASHRARDEVGELSGVALDLREGAARPDRPRHGPAVDEEPCHERRNDGRRGLPAVAARHARPCVAQRERNRPERGVELAGERDRGEDERCDDEPPPLEGEQHRRQEERDEPEQVSGRLPDAVRHQAEHHAADERGGAGDVERAEPPARERPRKHERQEHDEVVRPEVPEGSRERPVREAQQPALEVRRRHGLGAERVRVGQGRGHVLELVPDEPEAPAELEVIARSRLDVTRRWPSEVMVFEVPDRRPRRPERAGRVQPERHENEAGATGSHEATTVSVAARWSLCSKTFDTARMRLPTT